MKITALLSLSVVALLTLGFSQMTVGAILLSEDFFSDDGGFTTADSTAPPPENSWSYGSGSWRVDGSSSVGSPTYTSLISVAIVVPTSSDLVIAFMHRYSFEFDSERNWDGGQFRVSLNGAPFVSVDPADFLSNGYGGVINPGLDSGGGTTSLDGEYGFVQTSLNYDANEFISSKVRLQGLSPGDSIRLEWVAAWDWYNVQGVPSWELKAVEVTQVPESSFAVMTCMPLILLYWLRKRGALAGVV